MPRGAKKASDFFLATGPKKLGPLVESPPGKAAATPKEMAGDSGHNAILDEIRKSRAEIGAKVDALDSKMTLIQAHLDKVSGEVKENSQKITELQGEVTPMVAWMAVAEEEVSAVKQRQSDQEGRDRRNNVRLVGYPEGNDPRDMAEFMEGKIREWLPAAHFTQMFLIERAHRSLAKKPPPGAPPRPILLKFLSYRDRDSMLRAAREQGTVQEGNTKLMLFPDFSPEVTRSRAAFYRAKKIFREKNIKYALLFPARLRVIYQGKVHFFSNAEAAENYAECAERERGASPMAENEDQEIPAPEEETE